MFFAVDSEGKRFHASEESIPEHLYCPECKEPVSHREGEHRRWHFAHRPGSTCTYGRDKDYNHEWHIRMQEYFPIQTREYRFVDSETNEIHIADVFIADDNIVLEFQHSPISDDEFLKRTAFHLKEGRKVVWLFDESETNPKPDHLGRFQKAVMPRSYTTAQGMNPFYWHFAGNPYADRYYKWLRDPRKCLAKIPHLETLSDKLSICIYTGLEDDCFHRLQYITHDIDGSFTTFSLHTILMAKNMDVSDFFVPEEHWQQQPLWINSFVEYNRVKAVIAATDLIRALELKQRMTQNAQMKNVPNPRLRNNRRKFHF
jgi:hypothetical protein